MAAAGYTLSIHYVVRTMPLILPHFDEKTRRLWGPGQYMNASAVRVYIRTRTYVCTYRAQVLAGIARQIYMCVCMLVYAMICLNIAGGVSQSVSQSTSSVGFL